MDLFWELVKTQFESLNAIKSCVTIFIKSVPPSVVNLEYFIKISMFLIPRKPLFVKHWQENSIRKGRDTDICGNLKG